MNILTAETAIPGMKLWASSTGSFERIVSASTKKNAWEIDISYQFKAAVVVRDCFTEVSGPTKREVGIIIGGTGYPYVWDFERFRTDEPTPEEVAAYIQQRDAE